MENLMDILNTGKTNQLDTKISAVRAKALHLPLDKEIIKNKEPKSHHPTERISGSILKAN